MPIYKVIIINECLSDLLFIQKTISDYCINIEIIGPALSIEEGITEIENNKPDIVFLGVEFQEGLIFNFLNKFKLMDVQVIFISPERKYALNAFQVNATDFIMKPLNVLDIVLSINKAIKNIKIDVCYKENEFSPKIFKDNKHNIDFIVVSSLDKVDFLKMEDIIYCASDGKYTTFFLINGKKVLSSKNIGVYEKLLDSFSFYRIHHSYIVNIKHLLSINKKDGCYCVFPNNISLPIAKRRQEEFYKILRING